MPESAGNPLHAAPLVGQAHHASEAGVPLKIMGEQTIRNVDELHKALAEYLDRGLDVVVDLSEVDVCDTAALQLIYALRQSAVQRNQRFHIPAVSPAVVETAAALGLRVEALTAACEPDVADGVCEVGV